MLYERAESVALWGSVGLATTESSDSARCLLSPERLADERQQGQHRRLGGGQLGVLGQFAREELDLLVDPLREVPVVPGGVPQCGGARSYALASRPAHSTHNSLSASRAAYSSGSVRSHAGWPATARTQGCSLASRAGPGNTAKSDFSASVRTRIS
ncbi:hypothetical protein SMALB_4365 [Streptomyces malaysiensis]|uniref:Uncharacterized protein n=1 Tax=Streptomyces malaysiensis TaxID=92644 RepID=A0A7X5X4C7_STRMQ|nr:hypothetical protein [Streptomyces malaysiensis]